MCIRGDTYRWTVWRRYSELERMDRWEVVVWGRDSHGFKGVLRDYFYDIEISVTAHRCWCAAAAAALLQRTTESSRLASAAYPVPA